MRSGGPKGPIHPCAHQGPIPPYKKVSHSDIRRDPDE